MPVTFQRKVFSVPQRTNWVIALRTPPARTDQVVPFAIRSIPTNSPRTHSPDTGHCMTLLRGCQWQATCRSAYGIFLES
jgi:hypothetical protein